ncbi:gamma-glutamylcyclotransferase family protein [Gordonia sp. OPL2]|uniref:gamma-glutamylcyclotransferase family protein n=1 Tax=Gordonia sp. OPL2 TaxID=2486274 RepID=UPI001655919C|nr:gamma-glutamylcyclotransferase family protein [Gordonia sp. OPL2]
MSAEDGRQWSGDVVFLGIEPSTDSSALGALYRICEADLAILDHRELSYDRLVRTVELERPLHGQDRLDAFVYIPKSAAQDNAARVGSEGVIMARYIRLVDRAFRALGPRIYNEHAATMPDTHPFTVREIIREPAS